MTGPPLVGAGQRSSTRTAFAVHDDARDVPPLGLPGAGVGVGVGVGDVVGELDGVGVAVDEDEGCDDEGTEEGLECEALSADGRVRTAVGGGLNTVPVPTVEAASPEVAALCALDELAADEWPALELVWCAGGAAEDCGAECPGALDVPSESRPPLRGHRTRMQQADDREHAEAEEQQAGHQPGEDPATAVRRLGLGVRRRRHGGAATAPRDSVCSDASATGPTPARAPLASRG